MVGGLNHLKMSALPREMLQSRIDAVHARIDSACRRAGVDPAGIMMLAVTKAFGPDCVCALADAGIRTMGENRVQEAAQKIPLCPGHLEWHLIGHLQSNKVKIAVDLFEMIHSIDSFELLVSVDRAADAIAREIPVCLQINVSGEGSKFGFDPDQVLPVLDRSQSLAHVRVVGLMTIPPFAPDPEETRPHFRRMHELREAWRKDSGFALDMLSMGMSHDFDIAIEEGATCVRLGTALCGPRERSKRGES